jgi:hypothetical protein
VWMTWRPTRSGANRKEIDRSEEKMSINSLRARASARGRGTTRRMVPVVILAAMLTALAVTPASSVLPGAAPRPAFAAESRVQALGFDTCQAPDESTMHTWWNDSPYLFMGIYIGGVNRACSQPNLTKSWQTYVTQIVSSGDGWDLELWWVGDQSACDDGSANEYIPSGTTAAYNDGVGAANNAASAAENLGFGAGVIYFDLEAFNYTNSTCLNAAESFINGWDYQLDTNTSFSGGLYGSSAGSDLAAFHGIANPPTAIAPADYDGSTDVYDTSGIPSSYWTNERVKQYNNLPGGATYGGVTISPIDQDCADGPLNGGSDWTPGC